MSKAWKSPFRALIGGMEPGDTISVNGGPPLSKKEALQAIKESEEYVAQLLGEIKRNPPA